MKKVILFAILLVISIISSNLPLLASTAEGVIEYLPNDQGLLDNPHWDILVVTVEQIENENATNKNPPRGRFKIEEVLRGRIRESIINLIWQPPDRPSDHEEWKEGGDPDRRGWYCQPLRKEWHSMPLPAPRKGEKLIVFTLEKRDVPGISAEVVEIYRFTQENRQTVLNNMAPSERSGAIQLPLFFIILVIPIVCLIFLISSLSKSFNLNKKKKIRFLVICLSSLVFGIYTFYESGISIWTDIRIDLLLIYPMLLVNTIILTVAIIQSVIVWKKEKKELANQPA